MSDELQGCRVMISAGAAGIGLSLAQAFLAQGARVQVCDISETALDDARGIAPELGVFRADVSDPDQVDAWFGQALGRLGGLDVLINNAGIAGPTARIEDIAVQEWDQTVSVNLKSQYLCIRRAVPVLRGSERAAIINMSSVAGRMGYPMRTPYAASKWAVVGLTQSLALELGQDDITVNAILPGIVDSDRSRKVTAAKASMRQISHEQMQTEILANVALHRMVPMTDVAAMALFLASPSGRSMTGQSLNVCAGIQSLR